MKSKAFKIIIAMSIFLPVCLHSATINIPADQPTIQDGINSAYDLDTVLVAPGTYIENLDLLGKEIVLLSSGGYSSTILIPANGNYNTIYIANGEGPGTIVQGFKILGGYSQYTIVIGNGASPTIEFNKLVPSVKAEMPTGGIIYCGNTDAVIRNNIFSDNLGGPCITISSSAANAKILNNTFDNNISCINSLISVFNYGGTILNNIFMNSLTYGISGMVETIDYNIFWNNQYNYTNYASAGAHDTITDPMVDANTYNLLPYSPCIDAGNPDPQYNDPDGTRNDIGALFYYRELPFAYLLNYGDLQFEQIITGQPPEFYWTFHDTSGLYQTQYQIQVGSDDDWSTAEMWDPGPVYSSDTEITYGGTTLDDHYKYFVRVRVNNGINWGDWQENWFYYRDDADIIVPVEKSKIQDAIEYSVRGDSILVMPGTYIENLDYLGKEIKVIGWWGPDSTILTPEFSDTTFITFNKHEGPLAELSGFTIAHAYMSTVAIVIDSGAVPTIKNNYFFDNLIGSSGKYVITVDHGATPFITRNVFHYNSGYACIRMLDPDSETRILNNTFQYTSTISDLASIGSPIATNNTISSCFRGVFAYFDLYYNNVWNNDFDYSYVEPGETDFSVEPMFRDTLNDDFALKYGSPLIDAGSPDTEYNDPDGTRNDVGAIPYYLIDAQPDTLRAIYAYTYPDTVVSIYWGGNIRYDLYHEDVNLSTIAINGTVLPISVSASSHPEYYNSVYKIDVSRVEFTQSYGAVWGNGKKTFQISGYSNTGIPFISKGWIYFIGHKKGDVNADDNVNLIDILYLLDNVYFDSPDPIPEKALGDLNGDGEINLLDVLVIIKSVYLLE